MILKVGAQEFSSKQMWGEKYEKSTFQASHKNHKIVIFVANYFWSESSCLHIL